VTIGSIAQTSVIQGTPQFDDLAISLWKQLPDMRVDSIMNILIDELAGRGIEVVGSLDFLKGYLAEPGELGAKKPEPRQWEDIEFGYKMAKAIGKYDIGQTVVVKDRAVMAVEAVEGTDQAIIRGGRLAKSGAVVVKTAKPGQDLRFDVPVAGIDTLESMKSVGAAVLAVEAGMVLMVDKKAMAQMADQNGICIVGVKPNDGSKNGG